MRGAQASCAPNGLTPRQVYISGCLHRPSGALGSLRPVKKPQLLSRWYPVPLVAVCHMDDEDIVRLPRCCGVLRRVGSRD